MTAEVISFKTKDTSAKDKEVIEAFVESISTIESYNFFYLDAMKDDINTMLETQRWEKAISNMRISILRDILDSTPVQVNAFATLVRNIGDTPIGGIAGVAFDSNDKEGVSTVWSFMLCKLSPNTYIIRDLIRDGMRIIVRG